MDRRTFTKQSTNLSLIACFSPLIPFFKKDLSIPVHSQFTNAMQLHLDHFAGQMNQTHASMSPRLIEQYVKPVQILKAETTQEGYFLEYQNYRQHTISFVQKGEHSYTKISQ